MTTTDSSGASSEYGRLEVKFGQTIVEDGDTIDYNIAQKIGDRPVIDICSGVENVIDEIMKYDHIYTSSLHGIILCHTYKIDYTWVKWNDLAGDGMKFEDYFSSIGLKNQKPII